MPMPNFITARLKPAGYDRIITKKNQGGDGVDFLIGFKGDSSEVTSIHFSAAKFTPAKARTWLKAHKFSPIEFSSAKKEGASVTTEALARELSFDQVRGLVDLALQKAYPIFDEYGQPRTWGCRYRISQMWAEKALVNGSSYYAQSEDVKWALVYFSVSEDQKSATIDRFVPVQIVASPSGDEEETPVVLDESLFPNGEDLQEAGKRNSTSDAKKINAALRAMIDMMGDDDMEEETAHMMTTRMKKKKGKHAEMKEEEKESIDLDLSTITESSWDALEGETIKEYFLVDMREAEVDEENLIIKGTTILGPVSLNNRRYPTAVQEAAIPLFEGVKAYADHDAPNSKEARKMRDFIGKHQNIRVVEGKMRGDLHLAPNETVLNYIIPNAKKFPDAIGNSIVARVVLERGKDGVDEAKKIVKVRSVDMVTEPGTTTGLFESHTPAAMQEDTMDLKTVTMEQLRTERADLIEALLADHKHAEKLAGLETQVTALTQEAAEKDRKLAEYEVKETARVRAQLINDLVANMKTPDAFKYDMTEGKRGIKGTLLRVIERCQTQADMETAVHEWEVICTEAQKKPDTQIIPLTHESTITASTNTSNGTRREKFMSILHG